MQEIWQSELIITHTVCLAWSYRHFTGRELLPSVTDERELARRRWRRTLVIDQRFRKHSRRSNPPSAFLCT